MSKPLKKTPDPSNETGAQHDVAVAAAVELAMEFYGCDAVTAAAKRAVEARDLDRESHYRFWLHVFKSLKSNPSLINEICQPG
ncbi:MULTISPECIES: hypothetical protein [unclassified Ensifer]|uniref:hypothetical protein n=1 Tax=unclassified Ensifer TaxID=2633371 RepID=UPI00081343B7|nr:MULTISPECIES: hypothetical protein [unclassified Ensifer]OCP22474.1 hypothetical protein BC361_24815 [Ensifer sp. LC54]OCP22684.1 hypothetical protein BC363_26950 [Ensifer sp. LC384]